MDPESGRRTAEAAAERAGEEARAGVRRLRRGAREVAGDVDDRMARLTGRSTSEWMTELRGFVRDHPLQTLAVTVGVGYLIGKLTRRG